MKRYSMKNPQLTTWLGGIAVGAVAMYLADPVQGRRRRLMVQERMRTASEKTGSALDQAIQGAGNQLSAAQSRTKSLLHRKGLDDQGLQARIQNAISRLASVPEEIKVKAEQGYVTLSGAVALKEKDRLVRKLRRIPGVREIRDQLDATSSDRRWRSWNRMRHGAHPEPGLSTTHDAASADSAIKRSLRALPIGAMLAVAGLGYAIQSLGKNMQRSRRSHDATRSHAVRQDGEIHLQKSIEIQASPETVFNIWSKYDNFPQFMSHLVDVQSLGMQRSHWTMRGPAGVNLEWDAVLTKYMEPSMLAWKTESGAPIEHSGSVRFESSNGGTRATVRMSYKPEAGMDNRLVAMLGNDPEQDLEEDLLRMKNFIEGRSFPREAQLQQMPTSSGQVLH